MKKHTNVFTIFMMLLFGTIIFLIGKAVKWENNNMIEVWVDYEVDYLDLDKIILYRSTDVSDSMIFKCPQNIFFGVEVIQKLEYKLP